MRSLILATIISLKLDLTKSASFCGASTITKDQKDKIRVAILNGRGRLIGNICLRCEYDRENHTHCTKCYKMVTPAKDTVTKQPEVRCSKCGNTGDGWKTTVWRCPECQCTEWGQILTINDTYPYNVHWWSSVHTFKLDSPTPVSEDTTIGEIKLEIQRQIKGIRYGYQCQTDFLTPKEFRKGEQAYLSYMADCRVCQGTKVIGMCSRQDQIIPDPHTTKNACDDSKSDNCQWWEEPCEKCYSTGRGVSGNRQLINDEATLGDYTDPNGLVYAHDMEPTQSKHHGCLIVDAICFYRGDDYLMDGTKPCNCRLGQDYIKAGKPIPRHCEKDCGCKCACRGTGKIPDMDNPGRCKVCGGSPLKNQLKIPMGSMLVWIHIG